MPLKKYIIKPIIISLFIVIVYGLISTRTEVFNNAKLFIDDIFINLKYRLKPIPKETSDIAIISIDNRAYDWFGKKWPWGREIFAELVYRLDTFQPKVIGLNLAFIGASQNPAVDDLLAHSFEIAGNIISASYFDKDGGYHSPHEPLAIASKGFGFTNKPTDKDQVIRRTRLFTRTVHNIILDYSFELKTACSFLDIPLENIDFNGKQIIIKYGANKEWKIPVNKDGTIALDYSAKLEDFQLISILDILQNKVSPDSIRDKIVIMCMTGEAFRDMQKTPFGPMPGAVIIANNIIMFLGNIFIKEIPPIFTILLLTGLAIFMGTITYRSSTTKGIIYIITSIIIFFTLSILITVSNIKWDYFSIPFVMTLIFFINTLYKNIGQIFENIMIKRRVIIDQVTGLATPYYLMIKLQKYLERVNRKGGYLSLVMFKINNYDNISAGLKTEEINNLLKRIAVLIKRNSRQTRNIDFISHFKSNKFCTILSNTPPEKTIQYTKRIKDIIEKNSFLNGRINISLSTGISIYPTIKTDSVDLFIQNAENVYGNGKV